MTSVLAERDLRRRQKRAIRQGKNVSMQTQLQQHFNWGFFVSSPTTWGKTQKLPNLEPARTQNLQKVSLKTGRDALIIWLFFPERRVKSPKVMAVLVFLLGLVESSIVSITVHLNRLTKPFRSILETMNNERKTLKVWPFEFWEAGRDWKGLVNLISSEWFASGIGNLKLAYDFLDLSLWLFSSTYKNLSLFILKN